MRGFCPLASGSKGNCLYLGTLKTKILIDAGITAKMARERLSAIGVAIEEIDAILITHEHVDHIRGLDILAGKMGIPVFANSSTVEALGDLIESTPKYKIFTTGERFEFGDIEVHPFTIQHDAIDPVAFAIRAEKHKIGICTDLGFVTSLVAQYLMGCDVLYVEANHQEEMVHASPRPAVYKSRVLGRQGHLSNQQCAQLLEQVWHKGLKHVYLAHLSSECNAPDLALKIVRDKLSSLQALTEVSIAFQDTVSAALTWETQESQQPCAHGS